MKRFTAILLSVAFLLTALPWGAVSAAAEANLIQNGDFETGVCDPWVVYNSTAISAAAAYDGNYGLCLAGPGDWGGLAFQDYPVEVGKTYVVKMMMKAVTNGVNIQIQNPIFDNCAVTWFNSTSWTEEEFEFVATDTTARINICGAGNGVATVVYVDNISVIEVSDNTPSTPASNLVVNGDFETGDFAGWNDNASYASISTDAHSGRYAMQMTNPSQWGEVATQIVSVEPDTEYAIVWYSKRISGWGAFDLFVMDASNYSNLKAISGQNWMNETSGVWVRNEYVINTGDTTEMFLKWSCEIANAGTILIDDITVTKVGADQPDDPIVPTGNVLINGDFETGDTFGWENLWGSNTVSVVEGRNGGFAMNVISGQWRHVRQAVAVEPNTDYVITGWYTNATDMLLLVKDGNDTRNIAQQSMSGGSDWTQVTLEFNSGEYTALILSFMGNEAASQGTFDDFAMYKKGDEPEEPDEPTPIAGVINGDFETGDETGWAMYQRTAVKAEAAYNGGYGLHLQGDGGWGGMAYQEIPVEIGAEYTVTMWMKVLSKGINVQLREDDWGYNLANQWVTSTAWTPVEMTVTATTSVLCINFCGSGSGVAESAYVDDIAITKKGEEPTPSTNLLNGDFETGDFTGWNYNARYASISTDAHGGYYAMQMTNPSAWSEVAVQTMSVESNTEYTIVWYSKRISGRGAFNLFLVDTSSYSNLSYVSGQSWMNETSGAWVRNEYVINTGNATEMYLKWSSETDNAGTILIDDITVTKVGADQPEPDEPDVPIDPTANFVVNGDFENGTDGWNWGGYTCLDDTSSYSGQASAWLEHYSAWGEALSQMIRVEKNTDYVITFYTKRVSGRGYWDLFLMDGDTIDSGAPLNLTTTGDSRWFNHGVSAGWVRTQMEFNSGDTTKVFLKFGPEDDNAGIFLLDDVSLHQKGYEPVLHVHNYVREETIPVTCLVDGLDTFTCYECGNSYTEVVYAWGEHRYDTPCDDACARCGAFREPPHLYDHTADSVCNICGYDRQLVDVPTLYMTTPTMDVPVGETFTVSVCMRNNPGVVGWRVRLHYDPTFELISAVEGDDFYNVQFSDTSDNPLSALWVDSVNPNNTANGILFTATFRVKDHAVDGAYPFVLSVEVPAEDIFNYDLEPVYVALQDAQVTVGGHEHTYSHRYDADCDICGAFRDVEIVYGDADGDGSVTLRDIGLLQRYLNGWNVTVLDVAADVDGNGNVALRDVALMQRYLSGWDVELG